MNWANVISRYLGAVYVIAAVCVLAGCQAQPSEVVNPAAVPAGFTATGDQPPPELWWQSLGDPGLAQAIDKSLAGNFDLLTTWNRLTQARAIARREGAPLYPAVDGEGSASHRRAWEDSQDSTTNSLLLGLAVSYEVDLWGRIRAAADAATIDVQASAQDVQAAAISLSAAVARVWYELAEQMEQVRVLNEQTESNRQLLELITERFKQGKVPAVDVLQQRQLIQQTEGLGITAEQNVASLKHQLAVLLGQPPAAELNLPEPKLVDLPALPRTGLPAELIQRRPDVQTQYLAVMAADRRLARAIADQYPRISLSASLDTGGSKASDLFDNWLANLAANLVHPLFDAGQRAAEVDRTRAVRTEALNQYAQVTLEALRDVEDALADEAYHQQFKAKLKEQLDIAQSVIEQTLLRYTNGQLDYLRVLQSVTSRQSLERQYLTARRQQVAFRVQLYKALAGAMPLPEPKNTDPDSAHPAGDGDTAKEIK